MNVILKLIVVLGLLAFASSGASASVAGQFYPADKNELSRMIDDDMKDFDVIRGDGDLLALIVPHAGYEYSGRIAGQAFKQLTNKSFDTVIIIGPSHYFSFDGLSVMPSGEYSTPLGSVKIDKDMAKSIMSFSPKLGYVKEVWEKEHSVDVEIPFLQKTLRNFQIVPIVFAGQTLENCNILAEAIIRSIGKKKVLIVASSDLSHYHTAEVANKMDAFVVDAISRGDINGLIGGLSTDECEMCGYGPVIATMIACDNIGANSYEILGYADSGDVTQNKSSVVGYMSAAIYRRPFVIDEFEQTRLLEIARNTLENYLTAEVKPEYTVYEKELSYKAGVFVTLTNVLQLRGCIGMIKGYKPLYQEVQDMAIAAATQDIRFTPVTSEELRSIKIEISVLSPLTEVRDFKDITVGKHGLYIVNGGHNGILLPQVAVENNWTRDEFLSQVCQKAELPITALKDPNTRLYIFTAQVFREEQ